MTTYPRPDTISLVACGPSALLCGAKSAPGMVIAINGAIDHVRYDVALTMDGRFARNRWKDLQGRQCFIRGSAWDHARDAGATTWEGLNVFTCDRVAEFYRGEQDPLWKLNGTNSGFCALNLAYSLRPRVVYLYGFDMRDPVHFFGDYPWKGQGDSLSRMKLATWAEEINRTCGVFASKNIRVYNTNPESAIDVFPHKRPNAYI